MKTQVKCKICNDKGYVKNNTKKDIQICKCIEKLCKCLNNNNNYYFDRDNNSFKRCNCSIHRQKILKIKKIFETADIPELYRWKFIEHIETLNKADKEISHIRGLLDIVEETINNYSNPKKRRGLLLWSETTGNGKTLAAVVIMNTLILNNLATAKFIKLSSDYFGRLKHTYQNNAIERERDIIKDLINYDILIIDDFGTQRSTSWENEKLYELIDGRNISNKMTIITSNNNFSNIEEIAITDRIYSRLMEMCIIYKVKTDCYRENFLVKK